MPYKRIWRSFSRIQDSNGYTLVQACDGCCDRKTLWNFESGETRICLEIFCQLLKNIKVPAMEFFSAVYNYQLTFDEKMCNFYRSEDVSSLKKMLKTRRANNPRVGRLKRNWDIFVLSGFIHNLDSTFIVTDEVIDLATEYLLGIERFSTHDLRAFLNNGYIFNINFLCSTVHEIISNENIENCKGERRKYFIGLMINTAYTCIENRFLKDADFFISTAKKLLFLKQESLFIDLLGERLALDFTEGAYKFSCGEKAGWIQMTTVISTLESSGQNSNINSILNKYQKYIDNLHL